MALELRERHYSHHFRSWEDFTNEGEQVEFWRKENASTSREDTAEEGHRESRDLEWG